MVARSLLFRLLRLQSVFLQHPLNAKKKKEATGFDVICTILKEQTPADSSRKFQGVSALPAEDNLGSFSGHCISAQNHKWESISITHCFARVFDFLG